MSFLSLTRSVGFRKFFLLSAIRCAIRSLASALALSSSDIGGAVSSAIALLHGTGGSTTPDSSPASVPKVERREAPSPGCGAENAVAGTQCNIAMTMRSTFILHITGMANIVDRLLPLMSWSYGITRLCNFATVACLTYLSMRLMRRPLERASEALDHAWSFRPSARVRTHRQLSTFYFHFRQLTLWFLLRHHGKDMVAARGSMHHCLVPCPHSNHCCWLRC